MEEGGQCPWHLDLRDDIIDRLPIAILAYHQIA